MKELVETIIVFVLVILSAILVFTTKGTGTLDLKGINWSSIEKEESFNYDITNDDLNGEYTNNKGNHMYAMVGRNADGTYRIYLIHLGNAAFGKDNRNIVVRLDSAQLDAKGSCTFTTSNNVSMKLTITEKTIYVQGNNSVGDSSIEGIYIWRKPISRFSLNEFQIYK